MTRIDEISARIKGNIQCGYEPDSVISDKVGGPPDPLPSGVYFETWDGRFIRAIESTTLFYEPESEVENGKPKGNGKTEKSEGQ